MAYNKKLGDIKTPAGKAPALSASTGLGKSNIQKVKVMGSFLTNGASQPVAASNRGDAASVVLTSTGLYTVTLGGLTALLGKYGVREILNIQVSLGKGAAGIATWAFVGLVVDATASFQIRLETALGAVVDLAAGADNRVFWEVTFNNGAL